MKANGAFKLSQSTKRMLMATDNKVMKANFKKLMVQAEVEYEWNKKYGSKREKVSHTDE